MSSKKQRPKKDSLRVVITVITYDNHSFMRSKPWYIKVQICTRYPTFGHPYWEDYSSWCVRTKRFNPPESSTFLATEKECTDEADAMMAAAREHMTKPPITKTVILEKS